MIVDGLFGLYIDQGARAVRDRLATLCQRCAADELLKALELTDRATRTEFIVEALRQFAAKKLQDEFGDLPT